MKLFRKFDLSKAPQPIYEKQYLEDLSDISNPDNKEKAKNAFEKAWNTRNFEIELYWKRAQYFWAFQIPVFAAYFAIMASTNYEKIKVNIYLICCIGIIVSKAWHLINIGSKSWQRHWEHHIDHLENNFTGPLYKTGTNIETYSVSKINELVSMFFTLLWSILAINYLFENNLLCFCSKFKIAKIELMTTLLLFFILWQMIFQHGKGMFQNRSVQFYRRKSNFKTES
jgi:hypothetical protein